MSFNKALIRPYMPRGAGHYKAIFSDMQVIEIRKLHAQGMTYSDLAKSYATRADTIRNLCLGFTYSNVAGPRAAQGDKKKIFDDQLRAQVRAAYHNGMSYKRLCSEFSIGMTTAHKLVKSL